MYPTLVPCDVPGQWRELIHRTDEDRRKFLGRVTDLPERFGTEIHAFVLMDSPKEGLVA